MCDHILITQQHGQLYQYICHLQRIYLHLSRADAVTQGTKAKDSSHAVNNNILTGVRILQSNWCKDIAVYQVSHVDKMVVRLNFCCHFVFFQRGVIK